MNQKKAKNGNSQKDDYRYDAFLSYAHKDKPTVVWLHKLLTAFWVPLKRRRRIFMDQESLPAGGGLSNQLKAALNDSRFIIVCCSKHSAESSWVNLEVKEFLKTHPPENVLACLVGPKTNDHTAMPALIQEIERNLKDELFKPDLRGELQNFHKQALKVMSKEALSLLAPLVDLPDKESVFSQRKKKTILAVSLIAAMLIALVSWVTWIRSSEYKIRELLSETPKLVSAIRRSDEAGKVADWYHTLALVGRAGEALIQARQKDDVEVDYSDIPEFRFQSLASVVHALAKVGKMSEAKDLARELLDSVSDYYDEAIRKKMGMIRPVPKTAIVRALLAVGELDKAIAFEQEKKAPDNVWAMLLIAEALRQSSRSVEANNYVEQALVEAKKLDLFSRRKAEVQCAKVLVRQGQIDKAVKAILEIKETAAIPESLASIGVDVIAMGQPSRAKELAISARDQAFKVDDVDFRMQGLGAVADLFQRLGDKENTKVIALALSASILQHQDGSKQFFSLLVKGRALARSGTELEARKVYRDAFDLAGRFVSPLTRSGACKDVANGLYEVGLPQEAKAAAREAANASRLMPPDVYKSGHLLESAKILAKLGLIVEAYDVANQCSMAEHKLAAYTAILREYHLQHHPEDTKLFEGEP